RQALQGDATELNGKLLTSRIRQRSVLVVGSSSIHAVVTVAGDNDRCSVCPGCSMSYWISTDAVDGRVSGWAGAVGATHAISPTGPTWTVRSGVPVCAGVGMPTRSSRRVAGIAEGQPAWPQATTAHAVRSPGVSW